MPQDTGVSWNNCRSDLVGRAQSNECTEDAMSPGTAARGLSGADVEAIRTALDAGRKPKVEFTPAAGQIVGKFGQVIDLLDPSEEEWIVVRFGRDELPFSAADLAIPARAPAKRAPKAAAVVAKPEPEPEPEPTFPTY
ncbi:MAG TPA: hypothetical protein VIC62_06195, partial [Nakamurella sp.]